METGGFLINKGVNSFDKVVFALAGSGLRAYDCQKMIQKFYNPSTLAGSRGPIARVEVETEEEKQ